jgi:hypothetical protein
MKIFKDTRKEKIGILASTILICFSAAYLVLLLRHINIMLSFPYPVEYREGIVLNWILRLVSGNSIYPPAFSLPYLHNPYTPGFYWVAAVFQKTLPADNVFLPGRLLSFFSLVLSTAAIMLLTKKYSGTKIALFSTSLFLFSPIVIRYASLLQVDMTALVFALTGMLIIKSENSPWTTVFSGILCALSFLVKQTFFAALATGIVVSFLRQRKTGWIFLTTALLTIFVSLATAYLVNGRDIFTHLIFMNILPFDFQHFLSLFSGMAGKHPFLFGALALFMISDSKNRSVLWWYSFFVVCSLFFSAKIGAEENYFLEFISVSAVAMGMMARLLKDESKQVLLLCIAAQLILYLPLKPAPVFTRTYGQEITDIGASLTPGSTEWDIGEIITAQVKAEEGPILSEDPGYLVMSGKQIVFQPYQYTQLAQVGKWNDSEIVDMVINKTFSLIILSSDSVERQSNYFTPKIITAIKTNYTVRRIVGNYYLLEPEFLQDYYETVSYNPGL